MFERGRAGQVRSRVVQSRRPDRDRSLARRDAQYAAADPALARQTDAERELAAVVVMAAQHHDRVDPPRAVRFDQLLAAERIAPLHREEQPGAGALAARHRDRALAEIDNAYGFERIGRE